MYKKNKLKIKIVSSESASKFLEEILIKNIAKQIFEKPEFQRMLIDLEKCEKAM
ncbi:MAG TPA: hypothetical protein VIO64_05945 [Pseudobacteroides sp.]|uniref:hypothetical protein n=1 Tax=Pseudobacteroides sp. TaxID=1968840 RepID=UPI002F93FDE0